MMERCPSILRAAAGDEPPRDPHAGAAPGRRWRGPACGLAVAVAVAAAGWLHAPAPARAQMIPRDWPCRQRCSEKYRVCAPLCRRPTPAENSACAAACLTAMQACLTQCRP